MWKYNKRRFGLSYACIKDPHIRFGIGKPTGRTDTFFDDVRSKLDFILNTLTQRKIEKLIFTGDVFDVKAPSLYNFLAIREITEALSKFKDAGITIYSIAGNHDLPFASLDKKMESVYWYMVQSGLIADLETAKIKDITGFDYRDNLEDLIHLLTHRTIGETLVIHEMCIPDDTVYENLGGNFLTYSKIAELLKSNAKSKCKVVVCGHLHRGFKTMKHKDLLFINPWSMTRLNRGYYSVNDEHKPTLTIVEDENNWEDIIIPHKKFEDAFNKLEVNAHTTLTTGMENFLNRLKTFSTDEEVSKSFDESVPLEVREKVEYYINVAEKNGG